MDELTRHNNKPKDSKITTIKLFESTKNRVEHLRIYQRETYDDIVKRLLEILNICMFNPEGARGKLIMIEKERKRNFKENNYGKKL